MRLSGNGSSPAPSALARHAILPHRRLPHVVAGLGDSRVAAIYVDFGQRIYGNASPINWANALSDQRLVIGPSFGVSGNRTDEMLARVPAALASGAGLLYIQGGVNDISQAYPTATTSGGTAFANIRTMAEAGRQAGMIVVIEMEVGCADFASSALCGQVNELNARLYEYAERTPGIYLHDARPIVMEAAYSATAMRYRPGFSYDGTHVNGRGAYHWGKSLAGLLRSIVPQRFGLSFVNRVDTAGNGRRNYIDNPVFVPDTGGVASAGATGPVPASWSVTKSAGATLACSTLDAGGSGGRRLVLACAFAARGDHVRLYQDAAPADWNAGEGIEGIARLTVSDPLNIASVYLNAQARVGGVGYDNMSLQGPDGWLGPDESHSITLKTRPFILPAGTKEWLTLELWVQAFDSGSATIQVEHMALRRRETAF